MSISSLNDLHLITMSIYVPARATSISTFKQGWHSIHRLFFLSNTELLIFYFLILDFLPPNFHIPPQASVVMQWCIFLRTGTWSGSFLSHYPSLWSCFRWVVCFVFFKYFFQRQLFVLWLCQSYKIIGNQWFSFFSEDFC